MDTLKFPVKTVSFKSRRKNTLLQTRAMNSLSMDTINAIKLLTIDPRYPPKIVGSFKYIVHEYPADIDLFEYYETCCTIEKAAAQIAKRFINIMKEIKLQKEVYLGDFKAGHDNRYKINIGIVRNKKIMGYNPQRIRTAIYNLQRRGLLSADEMDYWLLKVIDSPTISEYIDLEALVRTKYIVRWNEDEIIQGFKILPLNYKLKLEDALQQKSVVKIDIWLYLNMRYVEMTNWYMLTCIDKKKNKINLSMKMSQYNESLMNDIKHYSAINKYMKVAKRLWLLAIMQKNEGLMLNLYSIFGSGAAKMYQIVGESETIRNILKKREHVKFEMMKQNAEDWKTRLGTVMSDILPVEDAYIIFKKINEFIDAKNVQAMLFILQNIEEGLTLHINNYVKSYFDSNNIDVEKILENNL
jgi:hypothetical protein